MGLVPRRVRLGRRGTRDLPLNRSLDARISRVYSLPVCHRILTRKLLSDGLVLRLQAEQEFYLVTICRFSPVP